jgi:hypothetical protein
MSTIAPSSSRDAIALLQQAASRNTAYGHSRTPQAASNAQADSSPAVVVQLSDEVKATIAKAKADQAVADWLDQQIAAAKSTATGGTTWKVASASDAELPAFEDIIGPAQETAGTVDLNDPAASLKDPAGYLRAIEAAHVRPDGSVESWTETKTDIFNVPSTPQEIDHWYETKGQSLIAWAQAVPSEGETGLAQAIQNRSVTIQDARDIPGLNYHNSFTYQGGEGGSGGSSTFSWNQQLPIFKHPSVHYLIGGDGTITSWKTPQATNVAASS